MPSNRGHERVPQAAPIDIQLNGDANIGQVIRSLVTRERTADDSFDIPDGIHYRHRRSLITATYHLAKYTLPGDVRYFSTGYYDRAEIVGL